jgi:hypothetical protein
MPASLRSDGVRVHPGMPFGFLSESAFGFAGIHTPIPVHHGEAAACPFSNLLQGNEAVELSVEPSQAVAETGSLVKPTKMGELPLVVFDGVTWRNEVVRNTVGQDDFPPFARNLSSGLSLERFRGALAALAAGRSRLKSERNHREAQWPSGRLKN